MADLIDRAALVERLNKVCVTDDVFGMGMQMGVDHAIAVVNEAPTIDAEPVVHGEWDVIEDDYEGITLIKCSMCHEEWCLEGKEEGIDMQLANYNYCPNCGADMRERKET